MSCIFLSDLQRNRFNPNPEISCINIIDVLFIFCLSFEISGGGAIACFPINEFLLTIISSTFNNCAALSSGTNKVFGGAIIFNSIHSTSNQEMIILNSCSINCSASNGAFLSSGSSYSDSCHVNISFSTFTFFSINTRAGICFHLMP